MYICVYIYIYIYIYICIDAASELRRACGLLTVRPTSQPRTACDSTQPVSNKQNSVAERAKAIVQDGARTLLMTAGLPASYLAYAVPYFCLCHNAQQRGADESP